MDRIYIIEVRGTDFTVVSNDGTPRVRIHLQAKTPDEAEKEAQIVLEDTYPNITWKPHP